MEWENCKKCPEYVCNTGTYNKRVDPKTEVVLSYQRGNILKTPEVSIRPICLLSRYYRIDYYKEDAQVCNCSTLDEAVNYIIERIDLSFESLLYYTKIKNEISNAHNS